jgi:hypothetical protein
VVLIITVSSLPGNYREHIKQVLSQKHQPQDEVHINYSLFNCLSGGEIMFIEYCSRGCGGTTTIDPDYCLQAGLRLHIGVYQDSVWL